MATDEYGFGPDVPPEYAVQADWIRRRRKIADALAAQAAQPLQSTQAGRFVVPPSWAQGLAQLGTAGIGAWHEYKAKQQQEKLAQDLSSMRERAIMEYRQNMGMGGATPGPQGVPIQAPPAPGPVPLANGSPPPEPMVMPASIPAAQTAPSSTAIPTPMPGQGIEAKKAAIIQAITNPYIPASIRDMAKLQYQSLEAEQKQASEHVFRSEESAATRKAKEAADKAAQEAHKTETEMRLNEQSLARADTLTARADFEKRQEQLRRDLDRNHADLMKSLKQMDVQGRVDLAKEKTAAGKPLTEAQANANIFATRAQASDKLMNDLEGKYSPALINRKMGVGKVIGIGGLLEEGANVLLPKNEQKAEQAQRNFVNAVLRKESGAVISKEEFENAAKQYFPQPGDSKEVIAQKRENRRIVIEGLQTAAGPAGAKAALPATPKRLRFDAQGNRIGP